MGLPMFVWARGAGARGRPGQRTDALVRMQAGNAEAATSAGFPERATSEATVKQLSEASPLYGLRFKLERMADLRNGCCTNLAVLHAGKGHAAELRCAGCGSQRGRLPKE